MAWPVPFSSQPPRCPTTARISFRKRLVHIVSLLVHNIFIRLPVFLFLVCMLPLDSRVLCKQDSEEMTISVFGVFSGLFQEAVGENGAGGESSKI